MHVIHCNVAGKISKLQLYGRSRSERRAERASDAETGRALIERAKGTGSKFLTVTGDVDRIVPASATATVADLLGADARTIADTGHLPLDERPQEVADVLLEFINC